ncbi:hypothetical protein NDU88_003535 [Pleurodeles waltl]|uniref:Uncharacterized protein n=1 Tax=Pleurodeles waltl TaxID=8319 RepID=A0AAV7W2Q6_PLEWA|nr:hypothetical protein NDU88_003535 [Pleurodeles waltl]
MGQERCNTFPRRVVLGDAPFALSCVVKGRSHCLRGYEMYSEIFRVSCSLAPESRLCLHIAALKALSSDVIMRLTESSHGFISALRVV